MIDTEYEYQSFCHDECMKKIFIAVIKFYQRYLSPMKSTKCPYIPTCSQYGLEAVEKYGAVKGGIMASWRILRCNPFSRGGYDPVPDPVSKGKGSHIKMRRMSERKSDK